MSQIKGFILGSCSLLSSICADYSGFQKLSDSPQVYACEHFLSDEECDHLVRIAYPVMARSTVVDLNGPNNVVDGRRTSKGMFIMPEMVDKVVKRIQARISQVTGIPEQNGESIQVLYYGTGGEYQPHFDYFDPSTPGGRIHFDRGGQRVVTLMVYLKTTEEGGETVFPKAKLKINPVKGKAVLFVNVDSNGNPDPMTLHGGAPVLKGDKWIMTRWLRERTFK